MSRFFILAAALITIAPVRGAGFQPAAPRQAGSPPHGKPNVIAIIADDMGHGDLGFHGNPIIKTPHLDRLAKQSVRMKHFYVSPVCSPTRASLLTGRYNYRTGVVDTFIGRSMMHPEEVTLAELLAGAGYRTGIFGKWHLGDCYPLRPVDQGFHEALVHKGGGIGQPSDPPGGESYFDPILQHNGKQVRTKGYCSDVYTDAAIDFIARRRDGPFFCYLAYNAPHSPLECPDRYLEMYSKLNLAPDQFPQIGFPVAAEAKAKADDLAKVYGMVTNIDDNIGRLLAKLDDLKIADNTIVIFLTDNGPAFPRYNSGMRGIKGSVFEGGTRVPFFVRWPAGLKGDRDIEQIAAHIDVTPTLLAACELVRLENVRFDGTDLMPLWRGQRKAWPERTLYFQWHRGDVPELHRACAARSQKWRLVQAEGVPENAKITQPRFMLFDMGKDPYEQHDVAEQHPDVVAKMKSGYEAWFADVKKTREFAPPRIHVGSEKEPVTVLTRQDWRGPEAGWTPKSVGHWEVFVERPGKYALKVMAPANVAKGTARAVIGETTVTAPLREGIGHVMAELPSGAVRIRASVVDENDSKIEWGARFVETSRAPRPITFHRD